MRRQAGRQLQMRLDKAGSATAADAEDGAPNRRSHLERHLAGALFTIFSRTAGCGPKAFNIFMRWAAISCLTITAWPRASAKLVIPAAPANNLEIPVMNGPKHGAQSARKCA